MRAMDLFMEKQAIDRSQDTGSSRALSREVNDLCRMDARTQRHTLDMKDKAALASAGILVGCPLVLLGLGASFAVSDEMDFRRREKELAGQGQGDGKQALKQAALRADELDAARALEGKMPLAVTVMDLTNLKRPGKKKGRREIDTKNAMLDGRQERSHVSLSRSWLEASKLVKRKQFLLDQIERVNKGNSLSAVSNLLSQIERLDKALKKMGC